METNCNMHSDDVQVIGFRTTREKAERLRVVAEAQHRTVSQELRRLVDQHLAEADDLEQAA